MPFRTVLFATICIASLLFSSNSFAQRPAKSLEDFDLLAKSNAAVEPIIELNVRFFPTPMVRQG